MPYVFFACPRWKQAWPKSAACWSPAIPATGTPRGGDLRLAVDLCEARTSGSTAARDAEEREEIVVPAPTPDVVEQVRDAFEASVAWTLPLGEAPEEPGVDVPNASSPRLGPAARTVHVVEDPRDLGRREVGIEQEAASAARTSGLVTAFGAQAHRTLGRAAVLPHDGGWIGVPVARSQTTMVSR